AHYSASKAAISSLARSLAVDLASHGIVVNAVAPGWVHTPMTAAYVEGAAPQTLRRLNPLARVGDPSEIATVIVFLVAEAPTFLTGATVFVDGGETAAAPVP
ncbi:MAG: SDR family oxidoreductase, partial [Actinomycetota bacterium]|nr:SDR family oxidoreductase [Actinomycetota bacterium]